MYGIVCFSMGKDSCPTRTAVKGIIALSVVLDRYAGRSFLLASGQVDAEEDDGAAEEFIGTDDFAEEDDTRGDAG